MHELKVNHEEPFHSDLRFSSQTKGREVCAVSGRVESFAGAYSRPSRAGCTTGAPTASKKEAANEETGRNISAAHWQLYEQHLSQETARYWTIEGGTGEQGFFERYKKKSKKAKKGVKFEPKKEIDKQLKQLKFLVGKKN